MRVCPKCRSQYSTKTQFCGIDGEKLVETNRDPLIGQTLGRYRLLDALGHGAAGSVYRALHKTLDAEFAVKVLRGDLGCDESLVGRFRREAQAASRIRSPHVVAVVDFETTELGLSYLVMEYVKGRPLNALIDQEGPFQPLRAARILEGLAAGLAAAHALGFVHRDVKPANVLVAQSGAKEIPKLLDFGIVRLESMSGLEEAERLTQEGKVIGTPAYMSPEQWTGKQVGPATDLYALGVLLYEMLAGSKPFRAPEISRLISMHVNDEPKPLPPAAGLEALAQRLLAKEPADRPASAASVRDEAETIVTELSFAASDPTGSRSQANAAALAPLVEDLALSPPGPKDKAPFDANHTAEANKTGEGPRPSAAGTVWRVARWALGAALVVGLTLLASRWLQEPLPAPALPPPPPQVSEVERELARELDKVGLDADDLAQLGPDAVQRWRVATSAKDGALASEALSEIKVVLANAALTPDILRRKLDRFDGPLAALEGKIAPPEHEALKAEYLDLYRAAHDGLSRDEARALALRAAAFGRKLGARTGTP